MNRLTPPEAVKELLYRKKLTAVKLSMQMHCASPKTVTERLRTLNIGTLTLLDIVQAMQYQIALVPEGAEIPESCIYIAKSAE